jgi:hypothetical protein
MLSPPPGTIIPIGTTTFTWRPGPGITQFMLSVGGSPGTGNFYAGAAQTGTSAAAYVPATAAVAYVTLSSLTASGWLAQSYSYAVGSPPVAAPLQLNATPTAMVPASGQEVLYSYGFSAGDARTITGVQVGGVPVSARIAGAAAGSVTVGLASTAGPGAAAQSGTMSLDSPGGTITVPISTSGGDITIGNVSPVETTIGSPMTATIDGFGYLGGDSGPGELYFYLCADEFGNGCQEVLDTTLEGASSQATFTTSFPGTYCLVVSTADYWQSQDSTESAVECGVEFDPEGGGGPTVYTISGTVRANGKPLQGAALQQVMVTANVNGLAKVPNPTIKADGTYTISGIPAGASVAVGAAFGSPYTIPITADGPANGYFYNVRANKTQDFSTAKYTTVYLLHGIGQSYLAMEDLQAKLTTPPTGLDLSRFMVDATFDFSECSATTSCTTSCFPGTTACYPCGISTGGKKLATQYLANAPWGIVLVGYSMGGLIARDVLVHGSSAAYGNILGTHAVLGLVTLGTPNWGYAVLSGVDGNFMCLALVNDMAGSWNTVSGVANPLSPFLSSVDNGNWGSSNFGQYWLAAAGRFCTSPERYVPSPVALFGIAVYYPTGCLEPFGVNSNDGVVCADSALYSFYSNPGPAGKPTAVFNDPGAKYSHTYAYAGVGTWLLMGCQTGPPSVNPVLFNPTVGEDPFGQMVNVINGTVTNGN